MCYTNESFWLFHLILEQPISCSLLYTELHLHAHISVLVLISAQGPIFIIQARYMWPQQVKSIIPEIPEKKKLWWKFKLMGNSAATYKTELNSSHSLGGSRSTSPAWTTFYDNVRTTCAILMKVCLSAQNLVTSVLKLRCPHS